MKKTENLVNRLKFPGETDLHSRVVWLSLFARKGRVRIPVRAKIFCPKKKFSKRKKNLKKYA
jgi:hypothetical protein